MVLVLKLSFEKLVYIMVYVRRQIIFMGVFGAFGKIIALISPLLQCPNIEFIFVLIVGLPLHGFFLLFMLALKLASGKSLGEASQLS